MCFITTSIRTYTCVHIIKAYSDYISHSLVLLLLVLLLVLLFSIIGIAIISLYPYFLLFFFVLPNSKQ